MGILIGFLTFVHVVVAVFLVILVLMQKSKDQGVGAAFGGATTEAVFGAGTTTALVRMTIWCACIFLGCSLLLAVLHSRRGDSRGKSLMQRAVESAPAVPASSSSIPSMPTAQPAPTIPTTAPEAPAVPAK